MTKWLTQSRDNFRDRGSHGHLWYSPFAMTVLHAVTWFPFSLSSFWNPSSSPPVFAVSWMWRPGRKIKSSSRTGVTLSNTVLTISASLSVCVVRSLRGLIVVLFLFRPLCTPFLMCREFSSKIRNTGGVLLWTAVHHCVYRLACDHLLSFRYEEEPSTNFQFLDVFSSKA